MHNAPMVCRPATDRFAARDGVELFEQRWEPDGGRKASVCLFHGYGDHSSRYQHVAERLVASGYGVYAMDLRGHGHSDGARGYVRRFDAYLDDVDVWLERLRPVVSDGPVFFLGHSMGGLVMGLYALSHESSVDGLVFSSAFLAPGADVSPFLQRISGVLGTLLPQLPVATIDSSGISRISEEVRRYDDDPLIYHGRVRARPGAQLLRATQCIQAQLEAFTQPLFVFHGTDDRLANIEGSRALYERAASPDKIFRVYEGGYHELFNDLERERCLTELVDWLDAHV